MKLACMATVAFLSLPALAQETSSETVEVTGSRIPSTSFGPIAMADGPGEPSHGCAEPNCGADPDDTGFGGSAMTQQQKNTNNKKAREKAKQKKDKLADNMKHDRTTMKKIMDWMKGVGISAEAGGFLWFDISTEKGTHIKGGGCLQYHGELNKEDPDYKGPCVERKMDTETVKKPNGVYETQLNLTYNIYDSCYWEKTCGVESITFIAGSPDELRNFLNETIGEAVY